MLQMIRQRGARVPSVRRSYPPRQRSEAPEFSLAADETSGDNAALVASHRKLLARAVLKAGEGILNGLDKLQTDNKQEWSISTYVDYTVAGTPGSLIDGADKCDAIYTESDGASSTHFFLGTIPTLIYSIVIEKGASHCEIAVQISDFEDAHDTKYRAIVATVEKIADARTRTEVLKLEVKGLFRGSNMRTYADLAAASGSLQEYVLYEKLAEMLSLPAPITKRITAALFRVLMALDD